MDHGYMFWSGLIVQCKQATPPHVLVCQRRTVQLVAELMAVRPRIAS
jgi:hypothetical protein